MAWHGESVAAQAGKYNVLFLVVDDLRPELGCYGSPLIQSPHIDALARTGIAFKHAYCQQALCGPSRTSVLTGYRPDTTKVWDNNTHFRLQHPDLVTLPQYFKQREYYTRSLGTVFHDTVLDPKSWSVPHWDAEDQVYGKSETLAEIAQAEERLPARGKHGAAAQAKGPAREDPDVSDNALRDGKVADRAIIVLDEIKDKPFFLAVGFRRPHLPFVAPKRYYGLYQPEQLRLASNPYPPKDMPPIAWEDSIELRLFYSGMPARSWAIRCEPTATATRSGPSPANRPSASSSTITGKTPVRT
jgi:iduronate 2-sulfatase